MYSDRFEKFFKQLIIFEGGFVDNIRDRGGKTKYGISDKFLKLINSDKKVSDLSLEDAKELYHTHFWSKHYDNLEANEGVCHIVFDINVNMGTYAKQRMCDFLEKRFTSLDITKGFIVLDKDINIKDLIEARRKTYISIVEKNPSQKIFLKGWLNRCEWFEKNYKDKK